MTEPKWTPGKWLYRPNEFDDWGEVRVKMPESDWPRMVARAYDPRVDHESLDDYRRRKADPYEANARLIAAAPRVTAALEELLGCLAEYVGWRATSAHEPRETAAENEARAALRAAHGEPEDGR